MTFEAPIVKRVEYHTTFMAVLKGGGLYEARGFDAAGRFTTGGTGSAADVHEKLDAWLDRQGIEVSP